MCDLSNKLSVFLTVS
jgi:hypothetical protein